MPYMERELPNLPRCLNDKLDPKVMKSNTDRLLPSFATPYTLMPSPHLAKPRREKLLPKFK
jgi:hypothetical protein